MCQDNEKPVKDDSEIVSDSDSNANELETLSNEAKVTVSAAETGKLSIDVNGSTSASQEIVAQQSVGTILPIAFIVFVMLSVALGYSISRSQSVSISKGSAGSDLGGFSEIIKGVQLANKPGVAIVKLYGVIQTSSDQSVFGPQRGADSTVAQLKKLGKNKNVKAVVLRINSPGGTVGASQEVYSELLKLKKKGIKIVASMADVCASGGVYAAVAADKILANKGTITGSVGVIFSVSNFKQLMEKVGMRSYSIRSGKFKDIGSYSRDMTAEEKVLLQEIVDSTYQQFLSAVVEGRGLEEEDVKKWADGRIFNGEQALKNKLVDQLGTFEDAIELAHELAGLEEHNIIRSNINPFDKIESMFNSWWSGPLNQVAEQLPMTHSPLLYYYPGWN